MTKLLGRTNRKSHTGFNWYRNMTMDDLEQLKRTSAEVLQSRPKNLNEDRHILSEAKCRPTIQLVSRNITYMRIFAWLLRRRRGGKMTVGLSKTVIFIVPIGYLFRNFRQISRIGYYTLCLKKTVPVLFC